jgi:hypothetical protein
MDGCFLPSRGRRILSRGDRNWTSAGAERLSRNLLRSEASGGVLSARYAAQGLAAGPMLL